MGRPRLAIALGSGSARGWAHIGVLRALRQAGITPDIVCGTSMGAFVGAAYASGSLDSLEGWARGLTRRDVLGFFDVSLGAGGLIKGEKLLGYTSRLFLDETFADLDKPFACVATDLASGREVWLKEGRILDAVRASVALPGLLVPQLLDGCYLVDGGLVNPVPVSLCRALGADIVIAVDLGMDTIGLRSRLGDPSAPLPAWRQTMGRWLGREGEGEKVVRPSLADVVSNSIAIMQGRIARSRLAGEPADVLIAPRLGQLGLLDFHRADEAIAAGRKATEHMLPMLLAITE
ncbi:MAG TPA: patatin-like phospholipase RssA [Azonexus sp.]|jgi:NTE family protein|nr:patatin-like phospholipase RssA [Azonexus sp.]